MTKEIAELKAIPEKADFSSGAHKVRFEKAVLQASETAHSVRFVFRDLKTDQYITKTWSATQDAEVFGLEGDEMVGNSNLDTLLSALEAVGDKIKPSHLQRIKEHLGVGVTRTRAAAKGALGAEESETAHNRR